MLEKGSTATAYEPYQGQSYELNLGKNLYDPATTTTTGFSNQNIHNELQIYSGEIYTFNVTDSRPYAAVKLYNSSGAQTRMIGNTQTSHTITFTAASNEVKAALEFYAGNNTDVSTYDFTGVQLEKGSQATSYAAYFEPIELCKIGDYQDYIYKSGGKWYKHEAIKKAIFDENSSWTTNQYGTNSYKVLATDALGGVLDTAILLSNYFAAVSYNNRTASQSDIIYVEAEGGSLIIRNTSWGTLDALKTWLASNLMTAYYALATPTDTEITNEALIEQLDNLASAALYSGTNNIFTVTPNEVPTLELDYVTYDKYNQNKVYIYNEATGVWQIIVQ
jgi:hypothetical protein